MRGLFILSFMFLLLLNAAALQAKTPLLQEGKTTLYQRVVTHPGATLYSAASETSNVLQKSIKSFSVFYIYERNGQWLQVGVGSNQEQGWVKAALVTDWNQAMTLLFTERTGRMPVLFFKTEKGLIDICQSDDMQNKLQSLLKQVEAARGGTGADNLPVLAAEPSDKQGAVDKNRFYLMPILAMDEPFDGAKFLQVASIDPGVGDAAGNGDEAGLPSKNMRTAIAFVIDTTISMKPYIEQSLNVVRQTFDAIEKDNLGDNVGFAIVAYRNNTGVSPGLEYVTQVVSDFKTVSNRQELEQALAAVSEAKASSHSFNEDSMAGIKTAVDKLSWNNFESRVAVLISDAGPLAAGDKYAGTVMNTAEMLDYAKSKNIWVTALHVRTPGGAKNHAEAEKAYRELTRLSDSSSSYIAIPAPDTGSGAQAFAKAAVTLAGSLTNVVKATAQNRLLNKPEAAAGAHPEDEALRIGQTIGYAMQLDFLGKQRHNRAPSVVNAWIADMDLNRLADGKYTANVEVAVLLTKNQLSDLQRQLKTIIDEAERVKRTDSKDFFNGILSASAGMVRDPTQFSTDPGRNLQQLGILGEFLEGLPYKSDVMLLTEEDWYRMSIGEQTAFTNRLKSRIARYEEYDKDTSNWESFGAPNAGDWVYRVPLNMLP